jgi:acyl-CoA thioesterase FadM
MYHRIPQTSLFPSELLIGTSILNVGNTSIEGVQGLYESDSKKLISVAQTKGVWFNTESQRPSKVPEIQGLEDMMFKQDA